MCFARSAGFPPPAGAVNWQKPIPPSVGRAAQTTGPAYGPAHFANRAAPTS